HRDLHSFPTRRSSDLWFDPAKPDTSRTVVRAGAFRGFGGLFTEPPVVTVAGDQLFVRGGDEHWLISADAFGVTFHRVTKEEFERAPVRSGLPPGISLSGATLTVQG